MKIWTAIGLLLVGLCWQGIGVAYQRTQPVPPPVPPDYSGRQLGSPQQRQTPFDDQALREMEEKRGKAMVAERQKLMVREANQLVQAAAELQAGVTLETPAVTKEEQVRRAELVEKLARNVKERMRGTR